MTEGHDETVDGAVGFCDGVGRSGAARGDRARAKLAASVVGYALDVALQDVLSPERGRSNAAFARQIAMYLAHAAFEMSINRVALAFGRDRSTVAHACHRIEDRRDEARLDAWLDALEDVLRSAPSPRQGGTR